MNTNELRNLLLTAFGGVRLEDGISIRQAKACDIYSPDGNGEELPEEEFTAIRRDEIIDDWTAIPFHELESYPYLAYLDAKGFRYYIPAFLLSLLVNADRGSMRVIATLSSFFPTRDMWLYLTSKYELLNGAQRSAIATVLFHLQSHPDINFSDQRLISAGLQAYWRQYLPREIE